MKEFWQIDCFTVQPFCGNPAAVVFDCDDMDSDWMQAVSREMNLSETVFFLRPTTPDADYRVRFFTPRHELPFAGHPTIASAHAFVERYGGGRKFGNRILRQECEAGIIPIEVRRGKIGRIYVMQQRWPQYRDMVKPRDYYARLLGCAEEDLANSPVQVVSTGVPRLIVHLVNEDTLDGLAPNFSAIERECREDRAVGITVFTFSPNGSSGVAHLRTFAPGEGVMEDPVCGSGNGAVGAYVAAHILHGLSDFRYQAFQGKNVSRPGQILVQCARGNEGLYVRVGGTANKVLEGRVLA